MKQRVSKRLQFIRTVLQMFSLVLIFNICPLKNLAHPKLDIIDTEKIDKNSLFDDFQMKKFDNPVKASKPWYNSFEGSLDQSIISLKSSLLHYLLSTNYESSYRVFFAPDVTGSVSPTSGTTGVTFFAISGTATPNATVRCTETRPDGTTAIFNFTANSSGSFNSGSFRLDQIGTHSCRLRDMSNGTETTVSYTGTGNFSVSASPSSRTVNPGQSASYTVTFSSVSGFAGPVAATALNWSNVPGSTASWSPSTVNVPSNGSAQATFTINTVSGTTPGTYGNIILRGTNGATTRSASAVSLTVNAPTMTASVSPSSGTTGVTLFTISGTATPNATVRCTETRPDGTTAVFNYTANSSGSYNSGAFTINQIGQHSCLLRDMSSGQERTVTYNGTGDFSASVNPTSRSISPGQSTSYTVIFSSVSGFAGPISPTALNWSNIPGATASWSPTTVNVPSGGSAQATFTINTIATTTPGTYNNIQLRGTNGVTIRNAPLVSLTVNAVNLTGSVSPTSGTTGVTQFTISGTATPNATVRCTETRPDGTTAVFNYSVNSSGNYSSGPFTINQIGLHSCLLRDMSSGQERTVTYTGTGDFTTTVTPSTRSISAGQSTFYTVTFTSLNGFQGPVNPTALNWSNVPGSTASWSPSTVNVPSNGSAQATFTINTVSGTTPGTYGNIILRGTNGATTRSASAVSLTIGGNVLSGSVSPTSGTAGVTLFTISGTATPNGTVRCTETRPDNTIAVYNYSVNSAGNYNSGTFKLQQIGQHNCVLRDMASGQERTVTYNGTGDFSASVNTTSRSIVRGQSASYTVTFNSLSGFGGQVTPIALNWANVPGTNASWSPTVVSVPPGGSATSTLTIQTSSATTAGTYGNIILFGRSGEFNRAAGTVNLIVNTSMPAPLIDNINPNPVNYNQVTTLTVNGANFRENFDAIVNGFQIERAGLTFVNSSQVKVKVLMLGSPPYTSTIKIINDGQIATGQFQVVGTGLPPPSITRILPSPVAVGTNTTLAVNGDNFQNGFSAQVIVPGSNPYDIHPSGLIFNNSSSVQVKVNMGGTPPYQATLKIKNPDGQTTTFPFSVGGSAPILELYGLEITQGIQDLTNGVVLIQDKRTFVRAYVQSRSGVVNNVTAKLIGRRNGIPLPESPLRAMNPVGASVVTGAITVKPAGSTEVRPWRINPNDSFLFELPAAWRSGTIEIEFQGISHTSISCKEDNGVSGDCKLTKAFDIAPATDISFIGIPWWQNNVPHVPTESDYEKSAHQIEALLPTPRLNRNHPYDLDLNFNYMPTSNSDFNWINSYLLSARTFDGCISPPLGSCKKFYMGIIVPPQSGFPGGTSGMAFMPGSVSSGFIIKNSTTLAHELAHNTGRRHKNFCGPDGPYDTPDPSDGTISHDKTERGLWGFDIFSFQVFGPSSYDMMTYCSNDWISNQTYNQILTSLRQRYNLAEQIDQRVKNGSAELLVSQNDPSVIVAGLIDSTSGTGIINSVYNVDSPTSVLVSPPGDYAIRFDDSSGQTVGIYSFIPEISSQSNLSSFALLLPRNPTATKIALLHNNQVLSSINASANSPTLVVTSPNGGEMLNGDSATVSWLASDADNDQLKYVVQYSDDNGTTWRTLATDLNTTTYIMNLNSIPATNQGLIRILATDGFHTGQDQSNSVFSIASHVPRATILTPENNLAFVGDQTLNLQGEGFDLEDGILVGTSLSWTSSLDGFLGNGTFKTINASTLTEGIHTITLTAQDSEGRLGSASVTARIYRSTPVIPASLSLSPAVLNITASNLTGQSTQQIVAVRNNGDGVLDWTAMGNQNWIQLSATSGSAPTNLVVTANGMGLAPGTYNGQITVSTNNAPNSPQTINVQLNVISSAIGRRTSFDYDGDFKTDISIFRPAPGEWWYLRSSDNSNRAVQFGSSTDKTVPADFTGDGKTDIAFWRESTGQWFVIRSEDSSFYAFPFGASGDVPMPGDYDGDGKADAAVFRPSNAVWYILRSSDGGITIQQFGASEDKPVATDYDGDGKTDIAIFRPSVSEWWILKSGNSQVTALQFGASGDKTVPGDYTGDGKADVAFYRPSTGFWYILRSEDNSFYAYPFGTSGDIPTPGDYDGDGKMDSAVFRPSNSTWYMQRSTSGFLAVPFGANGDQPLPNTYVR